MGNCELDKEVGYHKFLGDLSRVSGLQGWLLGVPGGVLRVLCGIHVV